MEKINKEVELELINITNAMEALERAENITADAQAAEVRNVRRRVEQGVDDSMDLTGEPDSNSFAPRRRQDRPRPNRKDAGPARLAVVKAKAKATASSSVKPILSKSSISTAVQRMKDAISGNVDSTLTHSDGASRYSVRNWEPQSQGALSSNTLHTCVGQTPVDAPASSSSTGITVGDLFTPASASEQQRRDTSEPTGLTRCLFEKPKTQYSSCYSSSQPNSALPVRSLVQARTAEAKTAKAKSASSSTPVNKQLNKDIMSLLQ
jgi:hypothetical protein